MQYNSRAYLISAVPVERKAPCEMFVDHVRGTVGFGRTYGEYSFNHQPLFGTTLPMGATFFASGSHLAPAGGMTPLVRFGSVPY
jgi:hypothetical protein